MLRMCPDPTGDRSPIAPASAGVDVVDSMCGYYRQRAAYYERVYHKPERQPDLRAMERWLTDTLRGRRVLELACGTGWWTPHGARDATRWLATDLNPETMDVARRKLLPPNVEFATLDAYTLEGLAPDATFDAAFAGCWWSHVPRQRLAGWVNLLHARLQPGARVVFLDNSFVQTSNLPITHQDAAGNTYQTRTLDDSSVHKVLKNFPTPEQVRAAAGVRARDFAWIAWHHYWAVIWTVA